MSTTRWVCGACGKHGATRETVGDESCFIWAVECWTSSLKFDETGRVCGGTATTKPEPVESDG